MDVARIVTIVAALLAVWSLLGIGVLLLIGGGRPGFDGLKAVLCRLNGYRYLGADGVVFEERWLACGAACVEMTLQARGVRYQPGQLQELREMAGTSMLDLRNWLDRFGVPAEGRRVAELDRLAGAVGTGASALVALDAGYLAPVRNPLFLPLNVLLVPLLRRTGVIVRHWVIVDATSHDDALRVRDPFLGALEIGRASLAPHWDGNALLVG